MQYVYDEKSNSFELLDQETKINIPQIVWVITDKCRCRCPFCFETKTNTEFNINNLDEYILMFKKLGIQKIDLSGGETLDYQYLKMVCEELKKNEIKFTISSSGYFKKINWNWILDDNKDFSRIIVSINGYSEETTNEIHGNTKVYNAQSKFLLELRDHGCENLRINTVISKLLIERVNLDLLINRIIHISPKEWCIIQPHPENKKHTFDDF